MIPFVTVWINVSKFTHSCEVCETGGRRILLRFSESSTNPKGFEQHSDQKMKTTHEKTKDLRAMNLPGKLGRYVFDTRQAGH
jgi:hypothetical protein